MNRVGENEEEEERTGKGSEWISGDCILPREDHFFFLYVYLLVFW
jgi:hypothetical protein